MYKKTLFAAAVFALASAAGAQSPGAAPVAPVAAPAAAPSAPSAQPAFADNAGVNPFIGKPLSLETRQRALEVSKMETELLEEQLKQATLAEDMKSLPFKKQVETAQATTARLKEERAQKEVVQETKAVGAKPAGLGAAVAAARPKPVTRPVKKPKAVAASDTAAAPVAPAPEARVELTSVLNFGGTRSAVLDIDGSILTAKHGDKTPLGMVDIVDDQSVRIGTRTFKVHGATLARVVISDPKPVDPLKMVSAPVPVTAAAPAAGAPAPASFPPAGQMPASRNGQPSLPPLQLPSGVTLLPPTAR